MAAEKLKVRITYFKPSGKFYTEGSIAVPEHLIDAPMFAIWEWLEERRNQGKPAPGLMGTGLDFIWHVEVPGHKHDHPRLFPVVPDGVTSETANAAAT